MVFVTIWMKLRIISGMEKYHFIILICYMLSCNSQELEMEWFAISQGHQEAEAWGIFKQWMFWNSVIRE